MTRIESQSPAIELQIALDQIVTKFGAWQVSRAVIARIMTRRRQRLRVDQPANEHLRKDLGLAPLFHAHPRNWQNYF